MDQTKRDGQQVKENAALPPELLKRTVDETVFEFETTEHVPELVSIVGQERGRSVMHFGLHVNKIGYNMYIAGPPGTGKTTLSNSLVQQFADKETQLSDWCYVYNFEDAHKPNVLQLPVGMGKYLKQDMENFIHHLKTDIPRAFNEETYQKEKASLIREFNNKSNAIFQELNDLAQKEGFVIRQSGSGFITIPVINGKPLTEEEFRNLDESTLQEIETRSISIQDKVMDFTSAVRDLEKETKKTLEKLDKKVAHAAAGYHLDELKQKYASCENVLAYLVEVEDDILINIGDFLQEEEIEAVNPLQEVLKRTRDNDFPIKYEVNLIVDHTDTEGAPVITADNPTFYNLIGKVEYESRMGVMSTNFMKIKPGFLHEANGGYIIIQAKDILTKSYAWEALKRALITQNIQMENIGEHSGLIPTTSLNPKPIPLQVKVIMIGNHDLYQLLYQYDEDFSKLFKIKADFDVEMDSSLENMVRMASFIHTHCKEHQLRHFDRSAVAKVIEYSIRLAGHQEKLSTRFNQQVEIIYEADTWAEMMGDDLVSAKHVIRAIEERLTI